MHRGALRFPQIGSVGEADEVRLKSFFETQRQKGIGWLC
jgi:hypothetical protein